MIDFSVEPEFQAKLDWMDTFVREECETMDLLFPEMGLPYDVTHKPSRRHLKPLQEQVKAQGLWACHLGPNLGGPGYGQIKLALMNEIIGRSNWAPTVFGTAAPDTGNAEILALFGTPEQKQRFLGPLMEQEIVSCFSMTEPQGGADPGEFVCKATRVGDEWEIEGEVVLVQCPLCRVLPGDRGHQSRGQADRADEHVHRADRHARLRDHP
jgi:acyl-CoA dehydrogenase